MAALITNNYRGVTITLAITGLPMTITGEVVGNNTGSTDIVTLKLSDGKTAYIAGDSIAFFF